MKISRNIQESRAGWRSRRGQAAVEAGLVILPLMAVLCGVIDFSMAMFIRNSLVQACREGTRYAITGNTGAGGNSCQIGAVKYIVQQQAMGILAGSTGLSKINVTFFNPTTQAVTTSNAQGNIVQVSVAGLNWLWMLNGLWQNANGLKGAGPQYTGLTIGAASADLLGPYLNGIAPCQ